MAAPDVTGVAALLLHHKPNLLNIRKTVSRAVKNLLQNTDSITKVFNTSYKHSPAY